MCSCLRAARARVRSRPWVLVTYPCACTLCAPSKRGDMLFSRGGFFAAVLLVLGPVTVLCAGGDDGNAGVLPMSSVTYDKDIPSDKASSSDPMANGTDSRELAAASQGNKLPPQQESMVNSSDVNSTSVVSTDASIPSTQNASVSAASMARDANHAGPPAPAVTEHPQTSPPTVQTSSPENTTVSATSSASHKSSPEAFSSQDAATPTTSNAVAKQTSSSSVTTPLTGSSTPSTSSAARETSSNDPRTTTPSSGTHEATTFPLPSPAAAIPRVNKKSLAESYGTPWEAASHAVFERVAGNNSRAGGDFVSA